MSERQQVTDKVTKHRLSRIFFAALAHLMAVTTMFGLFMSMFLTEHTLGLMKVTFRDPQLQSDVAGQALLLFGLASCVWALMFIIYKLIRSRADQPKHVQLKKARGTVITETLIVFPVFLCLTFGLAQMALTSIAGLLGTLASFEVARSLAVWAPEENNPHSGVSRNQIRTKMRLKAALTIAPATPEFSQATPCFLPGDVTSALAGMGSAGLLPAPVGQGSVYSMAEGFGDRAFALRGPTKVVGAFCNIDVAWTGVLTNGQATGRNWFTTTMTYHHPAAMPVVAWVFASNPGAGTWSTPYVSTMTREYRLRQYLSPNNRLP